LNDIWLYLFGGFFFVVALIGFGKALKSGFIIKPWLTEKFDREIQPVAYWLTFLFYAGLLYLATAAPLCFVMKKCAAWRPVGDWIYWNWPTL